MEVHMYNFRFLLVLILAFSLFGTFACTDESPHRFTSVNPVIPTNHPTWEMIERYNDTEPKEEGSFWDNILGGDGSRDNDNNGSSINNTNNFNNIDNTSNTQNINNVNSVNNTSNSSGTPDGEVSPEDESASEVVREADVIHKEGNLLVVLSKVSGIYTIEVDDSSQLQILDHKNLAGRPFEMTIKDDMAYIICTHTTGSENGNSEAVQIHSKLITMDFSDPEKLSKESTMVIDGKVTDTRMVGDFLYVVTSRPDNGRQLHQVFSVDLTAGITPAIINSFSTSSSILLDKPVIYATANHIYLAVTDFGYWEYTEPVYFDNIVKLNISGASGALEEVAWTSTMGPIDYRWQLDEFEGHLRIISQPTFDLPYVETYFTSDTEFYIVGALQIQIPYKEVLKSVMYDGSRGYLITALYEEREEGNIIVITDPLYILDLSNPESPTQHGSLEMPGFVHFMQVNGGTMVGLSVNEDGESLSMAIINVEDKENPLLVDRLNMPGEFNQLAEDFDRIHKALTIDWERGLILMPFAYNVGESGDAPSTLAQYSGIQMFHFTSESLALLGTLPHLGYARRSKILDDNTVLTMGDLWMGLFDVSNILEPTLTSELTLTHASFHMSETENGQMIYLVQSGLGNTPEIHLQAAEHTGLPNPLKSFPLHVIGDASDNPSEIYLKMVPQYVEFHYADQKVFMAYGINPPVEDLSCKPGSSDFEPGNCMAEKTGFVVVDFAPATPVLISHSVFEMKFPYVDGLKDSSIINSHHTGRLITFQNNRVYFNHEELVEISLVNSETPTVTTLRENDTVNRFNPMYGNNDFLSLVQIEEVSSNKVAFFSERFTPSLDDSMDYKTSSINIPGSPIYIAPDGKTMITMDYSTTSERIHPNSCYSNTFNRWFDYDSAMCIMLTNTVKLIRIDDNDEVTLLDTLIYNRPVKDLVVSGNILYVITDMTEYAKYSLETGIVNHIPNSLDAIEITSAGTLEIRDYIETINYGGRFSAASEGALAITYDNNTVEMFALAEGTLKKVGIGSIPNQPRAAFFKGGTLYTTHGLHGVYAHETTLPNE
jgi:Beta propeller domain